MSRAESRSEPIGGDDDVVLDVGASLGPAIHLRIRIVAPPTAAR
jgi:hypothetical protein